MPPVGFEPTISADGRPQTYVLDRAATGTGTNKIEEILCWAKLQANGRANSRLAVKESILFDAFLHG